MAADPTAAAAASAAAAISAVMDWRSTPDARAAAFAYLESVRAPPFLPDRHSPHPLCPLGLAPPCLLLVCSRSRYWDAVWRAWLVEARLPWLDFLPNT
jgi:hypothetical protein